MVIHVVWLGHEVCEFDEKERYYDEYNEAYEAFIALLLSFLDLFLR